MEEAAVKKGAGGVKNPSSLGSGRAQIRASGENPSSTFGQNPWNSLALFRSMGWVQFFEHDE